MKGLSKRGVCTYFGSSPNIVGFGSLRTKTLYVCVLRHWRGGGGGGKRAEGGLDFQERV